jgi:surfeit locus 1 family protein
VKLSTRWWVLMVAAVAGIAVTASLGQWQLSRAAEKEALQASRDLQASKGVLDAAALRGEPSLEPLLHRSVVLAHGCGIARCTLTIDK